MSRSVLVFGILLLWLGLSSAFLALKTGEITVLPGNYVESSRSDSPLLFGSGVALSFFVAAIGAFAIIGWALGFSDM